MGYSVYLVFGYTTGEMIPFQERKKIRKILYSKASLFVLFLILIFTVDGAWNIYQKAKIARAERDVAARALADVQVRKAELESSLAKLQSEGGVEADVREKFTVVKPGEDVVVVVDDNIKKSENSETGDSTGLWARITSFLGF